MTESNQSSLSDLLVLRILDHGKLVSQGISASQVFYSQLLCHTEYMLGMKSAALVLFRRFRSSIQLNEHELPRLQVVLETL